MKNTLTPISFRSPCGFTLVEVALVLGILGIIIGGVWILSADALGARQKNRAAEQVISTVEAARNYLRHVDLSTVANTPLTTASAASLGILPSDVAAPNYTNAYGGAFTFAAGKDANNGNNVDIQITLAGVPGDGCVDLLYARFGGNIPLASDMGFIGYSLGGGAYATNTRFRAVTAACAPASNTVTLAFQP